mgnify:CR=1 FL=1
MAKKHGVSADQVVLGNGSNELIELIVRARSCEPGDEAVVPHPVLRGLPDDRAGGRRHPGHGDAQDHRLDLEAMARAITPMTKMVFIANPNNPTATIVTADEVEHFHVAGAAAHDRRSSTRPTSSSRMGPDFPDVAGLRQAGPQGRRCCARSQGGAAWPACGWATASPTPDAVALMNRIRQPFNVNSLAQAAALAALDDESHVVECVRMIEAGAALSLTTSSTRMGIKYVPSRANFILVDVGRSACGRLSSGCCSEGVIVRPLTPFGMETALRVTIGTPRRTGGWSRPSATVLARSAPRDPSGWRSSGVGLLGGSVAKAVRAQGTRARDRRRGT